MADEETMPTQGTVTVEADTKTGETTVEQTVPYERFQQVNAKAKAEADARKSLEKQIKDLQAAMEERENAGLPELERERRRAEQLEKRIADAEAEAAEAKAQVARSARAGLVRSAAKDFADPDDAVAFLNLDEIEDEKDAERAVKALARRKPHLLKPEQPQLPGQVLKDGQPVAVANGMNTDAERVRAEAEMLREGLRQYSSNR
jgi:poly-gamma-glutamate capsule biosynthesis protein CapA/YwtB (metallophosphatase superfamily)